MIDPHVHFRDGSQSYKETILHGLNVAYLAKISRVHDIANINIPVTTKQQAIERIQIAKNSGIPVEYGVYLILTADEEQIFNAIQAHNELFPDIPGFKLFAGKSVGNCSVINIDDQKNIFRFLARTNYQGFVMVHCEKESLMKPKLWNPDNPHTHSLARPKEAEIESVRDIITIAMEENFKGHLHIAHVSTHEAVMLIEKARKYINISCGITPHHYMFTINDVIAAKEKGLLFKVNPPIRDYDNVMLLREDLKKGRIELIETDHAPHALEEKISSPHLSGFPGLPFHPHLIRYLIEHEGFTQKQTDDLTHYNIEKIFNIKVPILTGTPNYNLHSKYPGLDVYKNKREETLK